MRGKRIDPVQDISERIEDEVIDRNDDEEDLSPKKKIGLKFSNKEDESTPTSSPKENFEMTSLIPLEMQHTLVAVRLFITISQYVFRNYKILEPIYSLQ